MSNYRNGCGSYVVVAASATDTTTLVKLPASNIKISEDPGNWDSSNADGGGYFMEDPGQAKCTGSFDILHRATDAQSPVEAGGLYYAKLYTDRNAVPYKGSIRIGKMDTAPNIQGELRTTVPFSFYGVYDSPSYPTAVADYAAGTGRFAPGYVSSYAPAAGGAGGVAATGGTTAAPGSTGS